MCHCPQFGRFDLETKRRAQTELNPLYHLECSNCGYTKNTDDALPPWCPVCQFPINVYQRHWTGTPQPRSMR